MIAAALAPGAIPSPPEEFARFSLGPLTIHAYALCILLGIIAALWLTLRRWKASSGDWSSLRLAPCFSRLSPR